MLPVHQIYQQIRCCGSRIISREVPEGSVQEATLHGVHGCNGRVRDSVCHRDSTPRESSLATQARFFHRKLNAADVSFFEESKGFEAIAGLVRRNYNLAAIMMCQPVKPNTWPSVFLQSEIYTCEQVLAIAVTESIMSVRAPVEKLSPEKHFE